MVEAITRPMTEYGRRGSTETSMQDAIVRSMAEANHWIKRQINREGLWQVVIIERDEMGAVIKDNPNDSVLVSDVTWDRATSVANEFRMQNRKAQVDSAALPKMNS